MLTVGDKFPSFDLKAALPGQLGRVTSEDHSGKWRVVFFWPMDFTFVCPTEIADFGRLNAEFEKRGAVVLGGSTDTEYVHLAWKKADSRLTDLPFPMLADTKRELTTALGVLHKQDGVALRATFIVDPDGIIRFAAVNDLSTGRSVEEVLRVLDALQTGELCPAGWHKGERTLQAA
jgi:peroxiredoxin (alkyl hydroperoxide reductase subunit C)